MAIYSVIGVGEHKKFFDENSYNDVIHYILNPKKARYSDGSPIFSVQTAADEMLNVAVKFGKNSGKRLRHSVLAFAPSDNVKAMMTNNFAQDIIQYYAPEYQIVYAVHTNTDDIHIHFVMNQISHIDGHRYRGDKADYYAFQSYMKTIIHRPVIMSSHLQPLKD